MTNLLIAYGVKDDQHVTTYRVTAYYADGLYWRVRDVRPVATPDDLAAARLTCDVCERDGRRHEAGVRCWAHWPVGEVA